MRKALSILMAIAWVISTSGISFAFTQDGTPVEFTAGVTTGGTPSVVTALSATLRNISDDLVAASASWTGVVAGDDWVAADQYIDIQGFETYSTWGIQIYTDNVNSTVAYTGTGNPAGLVNVGNTAAAIPMCWRVVADKLFTPPTVDLQILEKYIAADDIYVLLREAADYTDDTTYFAPWFWMLDKNTPDVDVTTDGNQPFGDYQVYAKIVGSEGIQIAPETWTPIPTSTSYFHVYLGAKFTNAAADANYTTDTLTVEMYHL